MNRAQGHYKESTLVSAIPAELFAYIDDHKQFSSHMSQSSWMMGGGKFWSSVDVDRGQKVGACIKMGGKILGMNLFLYEIVTRHEPSFTKTWEIVGTPKLLVIGGYSMGTEIKPEQDKSILRVYIDYDLPTKNRWLGVLFGKTYAVWCVQQMINGAQLFF